MAFLEGYGLRWEEKASHPTEAVFTSYRLGKKKRLFGRDSHRVFCGLIFGGRNIHPRWKCGTVKNFMGIFEEDQSDMVLSQDFIVNLLFVGIGLIKGPSLNLLRWPSLANTILINQPELHFFGSKLPWFAYVLFSSSKRWTKKSSRQILCHPSIWLLIQGWLADLPGFCSQIGG